MDAKARMFQFKFLHNTLYVSKILFIFGKLTSPRRYFCKLHEETIMHLFYDCLIAKRIWNQLKSILSNNINFLISTPQNVIFRFWDLDTSEHFKPLTTYFQNEHLQCNYNKLLEYKSFADIYYKHKGY